MLDGRVAQNYTSSPSYVVNKIFEQHFSVLSSLLFMYLLRVGFAHSHAAGCFRLKHATSLEPQDVRVFYNWLIVYITYESYRVRVGGTIFKFKTEIEVCWSHLRQAFSSLEPRSTVQLNFILCNLVVRLLHLLGTRSCFHQREHLALVYVELCYASSYMLNPLQMWWKGTDREKLIIFPNWSRKLSLLSLNTS